MTEISDQEQDKQYLQQIEQREKAVRDLLVKNDKKKALEVALENPPVATKDVEIKKKSAAVVALVLTSTKDSELQGLVDGLNEDQLDLLMKYVYRCLETGQNTTPLLKWHAAIKQKAGVGSIVRALVERKSVL